MVRRGYDSQDERWFSQVELEKLKQANHDITWLINRGYKLEGSVTFVSNRFLFSNRQREALKRVICASTCCLKRMEKELPLEQMKGKTLYIDGFNLIITLEVALSGGTLVFGNDGNIRDLAGLRGSYRMIEETEQALQLLGQFLKRYEVSHVIFYLDAPVSNSKRLKSSILSMMKAIPLSVEVELVPNADVLLVNKEYVVSTDAAILDSCLSYFNLSKAIIQENQVSAMMVDFRMKERGSIDD